MCLKIFPESKTKMTATKLGWVGGICYNWNLFHVRMLFSGESELAHRLRTELDLADKLDKNLINQLAFVTQPSNDQPIEIRQESTSPEKEAEISSRLQVSWLLFRYRLGILIPCLSLCGDSRRVDGSIFPDHNFHRLLAVTRSKLCIGLPNLLFSETMTATGGMLPTSFFTAASANYTWLSVIWHQFNKLSFSASALPSPQRRGSSSVALRIAVPEAASSRRFDQVRRLCGCY